MKDVNILTNNGVNVAQSLELFGDMQMYDETLKDFLDLVNGKLTSLDNRKTNSDMVNYAIEVHALKSDARYLGFTTLADMCYESELKSKAGDIMFVQENHPKIMAEAARMINIAKQYMGMAPVSQAQVVTPQPQVQVQFFSPNGTPIGNTLGQYAQQSQGQQPVQANVPKKGIILIVDDSSLVANFVKKIFDAEYDVLMASDGAKAIEIVDQEPIRKQIKACLLDLNMPNVDGYQVLEYFKQKGYFVRMPVAVESGVEDMASIDKVNAYPIVDILAKPFNERDVKRVIEKCLATYF